MALSGFEKAFRRFAIESPTPKPTETPPKKEKSFVRYFEAAKDKHGNRAFIAHKGSIKDKEVKPAGEVKEGSKKGEAKKGEVKKDGGGEKKNDNKGDFTPEEDEKLRGFKTTNTPWKKIAAEMGRPINQLKPRWHELEKGSNATPAAVVEDNKANNKKAEENKDHNGKGKGKQGGKSGEPDWKNMTPSEKKAEGLRRKAEKEAAKGGKEASKKEDKKKSEAPGGFMGMLEEQAKPASKVKSKKTPKSAEKTTAIVKASKPSTTSEARFTMQEWLTLQEDDMFSFGEIKCISDIMAKKPEQTWDRIASRFFDKTGRRVHPLDIRDKFQGLAELQKQA